MLEEDLTRGERLHVWRRRRRWRIDRAAEHHGIDPATYEAWEADRIEGPDVKLAGLDPHEHFIVVRKRSGLGRRRCARAMGIAEYKLRRMEDGLGPLDRLIHFWGPG